MPASLVSVLINNYNYGRFLAAAIDSALAQDYAPLEVVVVDDGSTDESRAVIAGYGDRVRAVLKPNGGQASAFNAGYAACAGAVVCLLDSDDGFHPDKVSRVVEALERHPDAEWCFHELTHVADPDEAAPAVEAGGTTPVDLRGSMAAGRPIPFTPPATSALSFRRELLARLLPMPEEIRITSDNYLKWAAAGLAPGVRLSAELGYQRIHGDNAYTARRDPRRAALGVQVAAQTARVMAGRHPELRRFARGLLIDAVAGGRAVWPASEEATAALDAALATLAPLERAVVRVRGWVRWVRFYSGEGRT